MIFDTADILLPNKDTELRKWAVNACDQYTSRREYWQTVEDTVAGAEQHYQHEDAPRHRQSGQDSAELVTPHGLPYLYEQISHQSLTITPSLK